MLLVDDLSIYEHRELLGHRFTGSSGQGAYYSATERSEFQTWFWYRANRESREYAFSFQSFSMVEEDRAVLEFTEPVVGVGSKALRFRAEYDIDEIALGASTTRIDWSLENLSDVAIELDLYHYMDIDLIDTRFDDEASVSGSSNEVQTVRDPRGDWFRATASTQNLTAYEIGSYPGLLAALSDFDVDQLSNTSALFGPGDYTGAFQWRFTLAPRSKFSGFVVQDLNIVPEPSLVHCGLALLGGALRSRRAR